MADYLSATKDLVRFGAFELDPGTGELRKHGVRVKLQDQPFAVLLVLLEKPGLLVTREELQQRLWSADTFVEFDKGIYNAMKRLRETLGDEAETPRYIETIPKRGYRFLAEVQKIGRNQTSPEADPSATRVEQSTNTTVKTVTGDRRATRGRLSVVAAATLALLCGVGVWRFTRNHADASLPLEIVPLVGLPGMESDPSFSPDGNQVAFAIRSPESSGIYTTVVGGEKSIRVTNHRGDCCPRWSPDGRQLAFVRYSEQGIAIYVVPVLGGTERRLYSSPVGISERTLDWSPDGKSLAITEIAQDRAHTWIALLSLADLTTQRITSPSNQEADCCPAFSPDGSKIAFVRAITAGVVSDVYVVPSKGGEPKRLTHDSAWILGGPPAWTSDGRDILFSSMRGGLASLWRVSPSGGTPRPVVGVGVNAYSPSISRKENKLVYNQMEFKNNIWRLDLSDERTRQGPPSIVVADKGPGLSRPHFSPDGNRIAFESDRLGYADIWACNSDGSNCGQLTALHGTAGAVTWSPDGREIAFEFRPHQHSEVYLEEVGGGSPRLLETFARADNGGPKWSRDGKWIYFYSNHGGSFEIWKTQPGGGPPIRVTANGGLFGEESSDGRFLYFSKMEAPGLWKLPLHGGQETHLFDQPFVPFSWWDWGLTDKGIYFIDFKNRPNTTVAFFEFATNKIFPIWTLTNHPFVGLSVSPDGKSILYAQREYAKSDIMLVKNFH